MCTGNLPVQPGLPPMNERPHTENPPCTLSELTWYFFRLGAFGFGGPIALAGYMQRDLVEDRKWISAEEYKDGLALAQLAPGPLAAQLAMYLGWVRGGTLGSSLVGFAFVIPSFVMVVVLSVIYVRMGGVSAIQGLFYGMGAAVIAIIARSAVKLAKLTLQRDRLLWTIFAVNAAVTAATESEILWMFLGSGVLVLLVRARRSAPPGAALWGATLPAWLLTGLGPPANAGTLVTLILYFAEAGAFVFGSGLAIVPFLHGGVVDHHRWLTERQFLDAVAVAMITPGPVVITVAFIGYLVAGLAGSIAAAVGVFLPCWAFVVVPAPYFKKYGHDPRIKAFGDGVTAAATGAIAGAAVVLARRSLVDAPTIAIAIAVLAITGYAKKVSEPGLVLAAGALGIALTGWGIK
jgi:chromate transporter